MLRKNINLGEWIAFIFMPALVFPVYWMIAVFIDWVFGDSSVILQIEYASKGQLLSDYLADWVAALPFSFIVSWLVVLPIYYFCKKNKFKVIATYSFIGMVAWVGIGLWLYRLDLIGLVIMVMTGSVLAVGLYLLHLWSECSRRAS